MAKKVNAPTGGSLTATALPTSFGSSWRLDVDVAAITDIVLHLSHVNSAAATITLLLSSSPDATTYYPLARITSAGAASDGEVTWAVTGNDSLGVPLSVGGTRYLRIEAKADASSGDTLAAEVTGGVRS